MIRAVFFDLEGVIIYHKKRQARLLKDAFKINGFLVNIDVEKIYYLRSIKEFNKLINFLREISKRGRLCCSKNDLKKVKETYLTLRKKPHYKENLQTLIKGAVECLALTQARGIKIALITNTSKQHCARILKRFRLKGYFDLVLDDSSGLKRKPSFERFSYGLKEFGLKPDEVLLVEDNADSINCGKKLGLKTCAVLTGTANSSTLNGADWIVKSIFEVKELVSNESMLTFGDHFLWKDFICLSFDQELGDKIVGFPRYVPSKKGRKIQAKKYEKLKVSYASLKQNLENPLLKKHYAFSKQLGGKMFQLPASQIKEYYFPDEKFNEILAKKKRSVLEGEVFKLSKIIQKLVNEKLIFGVGGSILLGCPKKKSDIDLYIYTDDPLRVATNIRRLFLYKKFKCINFKDESKTRVDNWARLFSKKELGEYMDKKFQAADWILEGYYKNRMFNLLFVRPRRVRAINWGDYKKVELTGRIISDKGILLRPSEFVVKSKKYGVVTISSLVRTHSILKKGDWIRVVGNLQKNGAKKCMTILWVEKNPIQIIS